MTVPGAIVEAAAGVGLYIHVPYCRALCHYCDFAKTANFSPNHLTDYLVALERELSLWLQWLKRTAPRARFASVFFGGGTPSLFGEEYRPIMEQLASFLAPGAEVTLEANPDDLSDARLKTWKALGVNRLSVGVQTLDRSGLTLLRRIHDGSQALFALERAVRQFDNVNADLIYGWGPDPRGTLLADLVPVIATGITHLSLYTLTFESRTPLGRAKERGRLKGPLDDDLADAYEAALTFLNDQGFRHEEVSNWSRPGKDCIHNWLYWQEGSWLSVGAGAHGYWRAAAEPGERWSQPRDDRRYVRAVAACDATHEGDSASSLARRLGAHVEDGRTIDGWIAEYVGASLRTARGCDLGRIQEVSGRRFVPSQILSAGLSAGIISIDATRLRLTPREWFREMSWSLELLKSFPESPR